MTAANTVWAVPAVTGSRTAGDARQPAGRTPSWARAKVYRLMALWNAICEASTLVMISRYIRSLAQGPT